MKDNETGQSLCYIINFIEDGYAVISADIIVAPIICFGNFGSFDTTNMFPNKKFLFETYLQEIKIAKQNGMGRTRQIDSLWEKASKPVNIKRGVNSNVSPLLQSKWTQGLGFNFYCPFDADHGTTSEYKYSLVGCLPLAMAQIMNYYKYPLSGSGSNEYYTHSRNFHCKANFAGTSYNYDDNESEDDNDYWNLKGTPASAKLCYHAGVAINVDYDYLDAQGNVATSVYVAPPLTRTKMVAVYETVKNAMINNFLYDKGMHVLEKDKFSGSKWTTMLRAEMLAGRPVLYYVSGIDVNTGHGSGHVFVVDGVKQKNYFHINWGWGNSNDQQDCWWNLNNIAPTFTWSNSSQTQTQSYIYNTAHIAIFGITPDCINNLKMDRSNKDKNVPVNHPYFGVLDKDHYPEVYENKVHSISTWDVLETNEHIMNEVHLKSTHRVILKPGFTARHGANLSVDNRGCVGRNSNSGNAPPLNPDPQEMFVCNYTGCTDYWNLIFPPVPGGGGLYFPNTFIPCKTSENGPPGKIYVPNGFLFPKKTNSDTLAIEKKTNQILISPNPAKGKLTILGMKKNDELVILNSMAAVVLSTYSDKEGAIEISLAGFPPGIYVLQISDRGWTTKLIVE